MERDFSIINENTCHMIIDIEKTNYTLAIVQCLLALLGFFIEHNRKLKFT